MKFVGAGWSGNARQGFQFNPVEPPAEPTGAVTPTGACCDDCNACSVTTESDCSGTWFGPGTTCSPSPCPCDRFNVAIRFQFSSTNLPADGLADFTKNSNPLTATLGECFQVENWNNSEFMTYHCTLPGALEAVTFNFIDYSLQCVVGIGWLLDIDWTGGTLVCLRNFAFQPSDLLGPDPTGTHVYTLDAFGGEWHFIITVDITPYP